MCVISSINFDRHCHSVVVTDTCSSQDFFDTLQSCICDVESCGFITSGRSGGVDKSVTSSGSNVPSAHQTQKDRKIVLIIIINNNTTFI